MGRCPLPQPETTLYAVYPTRQHLVPKIRAFVDFAAEVFGDAQAAKAG